MPSYSFQIRKAEHLNDKGEFDLHVHAYYNERGPRRLLGRYRLPTLEPIFSNEPNLTQEQIKELAGWLSEPAQIEKLKKCLKDTIFNMHKVAKISPRFGEVLVDQGETYINIRIPIAKRIK